MNTIWLNSKTKIPSIADSIIDRGRLHQLLEEAKTAKLTVVQAPAGYGKTTILSQWISLQEEPASWLSIDATDNDPIRYWRYLIQSVSDAANNDLDTKLSPLFATHHQSPYELTVDSLLNELSLIKENLHIVLDDYHLIDHPVIHDMMTRFIDYLPSNIRLYILSRSKVALPLARWRSKSWIADIGMEQLSFTIEEITRLYEKKNLSAHGNGIIESVLKETEGWAAGIQLVSLSAKKDQSQTVRFDESHPFAAEFLMDEIFETLPLPTQDFLMRTSVLNTLEPEICNKLTNRLDSHELLSRLAEKGIFTVQLSSNNPIFRYHHLFGDVLKKSMAKFFKEEQVEEIYKRAGILLCEKGDFISAIDLVLQQRLYVLADYWITKYLVDIFTTGQISTLVRWVEVLRGSGHPLPLETLVMYTIALTSIKDLKRAKVIMDELEERHLSDQWMDHADNQGVATIFTTLKAYILFALGDEKQQVAEIIMRQLEEGRVSSRWDHIPMQYNQFEAKISRTLIGSKGKFPPIDEAILFGHYFRQTEFKEQNMMGFSYGVLAESMYEVNMLEEALREIEGGLQYAYRFDDTGLSIPLYILKGRIHMAKRQFTTAHSVLDHAIDGVKEWYWIRSLQAMKAHVHISEGDMEKAEAELFRIARPDLLKIELGQEFWLLVYVRFLLASGDVQEALKFVIRVKEKSLYEEQISTIIEASLLESLCYMKMNMQDSAFEAIHKAFELGSSYGYKRIFIDEADFIPSLKKYAAFRQRDPNRNWDSVPLAYVEELLEMGDEFTEESREGILTPREMDVLRLLASGASNKQIASQLFLSEGTIRVYLTNIYSKLGVQSRTQAILLAKEWNL